MKTTTATRTLALITPVSGPLVPIELVPDPVFAQKIVGDGISINPLSNEFLAPCAGKILHLHPAVHALTLGNRMGLNCYCMWGWIPST